MLFIHKVVLVCLYYSICSKSQHIPGDQNRLADSLPRLQLQIFNLNTCTSLRAKSSDSDTSSFGFHSFHFTPLQSSVPVHANLLVGSEAFP